MDFVSDVVDDGVKDLLLNWDTARRKDRARWVGEQLITTATECVRDVSRDLVAEELDKNAAEMSFTCPRAWSLLAMEAFQSWPASV